MSEKRSPEARKRRAAGRARAIVHQRLAEQAAAKRAVADAAERRVVTLTDGRTGRLMSVPSQSSHVSQGAKARVLLPSGAVISVPLSELTVTA